jgi:hypothetical protein
MKEEKLGIDDFTLKDWFYLICILIIIISVYIAIVCTLTGDLSMFEATNITMDPMYR